jgi:aspartate/methionine/tyrosine aminotransferase
LMPRAGADRPLEGFDVQVKSVPHPGYAPGAFYVFADASKWTDDSYAFAFELLEKAGVGVAPGVDFGQAGKQAVRFSYASSEENIREAARRLGEYLGKR